MESIYGWCEEAEPINTDRDMNAELRAVTRRNTRLQRIQNWPELAELAKWSVTGLAKRCGLSKRALQRHFQNNVGKPPKAWLLEARQKRAIKLLETLSVKETAAALGYRHATHFSREFKKYWGYSPVEKPPLLNSAQECRVLV
ncbi:MAG: helix-turn-helix transcriptional regulator [Verrucomicrobiota bacterium]